MRRSSALFLGPAVAGLLVISGCGPSSPKVPDTPDGTVTTVMQSLAENKPEVAWAALPASYQKQLQDDVVRAFAAKMDPEIYSKSVAVLKKLTGLLESKKDLIIPMVTGNPMVQMAQVNPTKVRENWSKVVGLLDTVLDSELGDLDALKSIDIGSFLRTTGGKVMTQVAELSALAEGNPYKSEFQDKAKAMTVEVVQVEGDKATVKSTIPGQPSSTDQLVKVEGKWLPVELVEEWDDFIAEAKSQIAAMSPEQIAGMKPGIMGGLTAAETALDQLAKAKTAEEMGQVLGGLMENMPIPFGLPGMDGDVQEPPPGFGPIEDMEDMEMDLDLDVDVEEDAGEDMVPEDAEAESEG